jgi:hypothetical protein
MTVTGIRIGEIAAKGNGAGRITLRGVLPSALRRSRPRSTLELIPSGRLWMHAALLLTVINDLPILLFFEC